MNKITLTALFLVTGMSYPQTIEMNGTLSAQNHQINNVASPSDARYAVNKAYTGELIASLQSQIDATAETSNVENPVPSIDLTDTTFYIDQEIDGVNVSREVIIEVPNTQSILL